VADSTIKSVNGLPEVVSLMNEVARLQRVLQSSCDARVRSEASAQLREQQLRLDIAREQRKRSSSGPK
jgi:hypothetical protein